MSLRPATRLSRRSLLAIVGVLASAAMLWIALRNADFQAIRRAFTDANAGWAAPFLGALVLFYWLKSVRWRDLLATQVRARPKELFPAVMIGYAGTAILPMQMGELVRTYIVGKQFKLPFTLVLSSIGIERIFDLLTILLFLGLALGLGQEMPNVFVTASYAVGAIVIGGFATAIWLAMRPETALQISRSLTGWMPARASNAIVGILQSVSRGLQSIRQPTLVARVTANSLIQWTLMGVCIWCSILALHLNVPASGVVLVLVATIVGISLPTSPGYIGNIQLAFVVALQPFGVSASEAIAASLFYHVLAYVTVIVVGFYFLSASDVGFLELQNAAQSSTQRTREDVD